MENATFNIGDRVHIKGYSDVRPATVVAVRRNGKEIDVRRDNFKLAENEKPEFIAGGFAGHCTNQDNLKYAISENAEGHVSTYCLYSKKFPSGKRVFHWNYKGNGFPILNTIGKGWHAFYDYNF